jgi:hypothetical protein
LHDQSAAAEEFSVLPLVQPCPDGSPLDRAAICSLCSAGLSECPVEDQCIAWLVLLGVFPDSPFDWPEKRSSLISEYRSLIDTLSVSEWHTRFVAAGCHREDLPVPDDAEMWSIHVDVVRTIRHIIFLPPAEALKDAPDNFMGLYAAHMRRIERILYAFALTNSSMTYGQGFNELAAILYFVNTIAIHSLTDDPFEAEALTFACFRQLMTASEIWCYYVVSDGTAMVMQRMDEFFALLRRHLPRVHAVLERLGISPMHFGVRWFNVLFAQEHQMSVVLMIWDSLFAHFDELMQYAGYIAVAHIEAVSGRISETNFSVTMKTLQPVKIVNICPVLRRAEEMWRADHAGAPPEKKGT